MKCLYVREPFAGWIVDGVKRVEYRKHQIRIRGRIGIIACGTGTVIGVVDIYNCVPALGYSGYAIGLTNAYRFSEPVPFQHKKGCQVWTDVEIPKDVKYAEAISNSQYIAESEKYHKAMAEFMKGE